ncbi:MAG: hypothetical protein Q4E55_03430 [Bacteroidales bacterium]|nr:hypothetical protein [Bacteroidales bacterium]
MMKPSVICCFRRFSQFAVWLPYILLLASCSRFTELNPSSVEHETHALAIRSMNVSTDVKQISLELDITHDLDKYLLEDSSLIHMTVKELKRQFVPWSESTHPHVVSFNNVVASENAKLGLKLLLMVDLCQSSDMLEKERDYIRSLIRLYGDGNVFISFILSEGELSPIMEVSPYVIDNYVNGNSKYRVSDTKLPPYVYRALYFMLGKLRKGTGTPLDSAAYRTIAILSDSHVYDETDNTPLDPDHYWVQAQILQQLADTSFSAPAICYVCTPSTDSGNSSTDDKDMMQVFCQQSGGGVIDGLSAVELRKHNFASFGIGYPDFAIRLENPDGKIYYGCSRRLELSFHDRNDSLIARCSKEYACGSIDVPIVTGGYKSPGHIASRGIIIALLVLLLAYVALQLLEPFVRYVIFQRKYVLTYTGGRMSINAIAIPDECYYCKAPFAVGDRIVARCSHVMHLECWNENGQHCPEHGRHCPDGSHYYNRSNLLDPQNASPFTRWILVAIAAASIGWLVVWDPHFRSLFLDLFDGIAISLLGFHEQGVSPFSPQDLDIISSRLYTLPTFGCIIGFVLTFALSIFTLFKYSWHIRLFGQFVRASVACVLVFFVFVFNNATLVVLNLYEGSFVFDLLPWVLTTLVIACVSTYHSRLWLKRRQWLMLAVVGVASTLFWEMVAELQTVSELMKTLFVFIGYGVAIAVCMTQPLSVGKHFFLHVSGSVKDMDIALYKWLRSSPHTVVTIGKSVDCALQLTWDLQSDVAPVQVKVYERHGVVRICAVDGITLKGGKYLALGKEYQLWHGESFQIGQTSFHLVEM